jgi:GMP synthase (glutamine-hydrolysing)
MASRRILVLQHVAYEILGTLNPHLRQEGFRMRYVNFGRDPQATPTLDGYHGMVVLGGPMCLRDADDHPHLRYEIALIQEGLSRNIPILGICLGAQLVAAALKAPVGPNPTKEIGWYDLQVTPEGLADPLFAHFGPQEKIFQWHGDTFDIPEHAVHLASSPTCHHQAFRYGKKVYGLQFHLEVDAPLIARWLKVPFHQREMETMGTTIDPEQISRETAQFLPRSTMLSTQTFRAFTRLFE